MLAESRDSIKKRASKLAKQINKLGSLNARLVDDVSYVGGGSAPMNELPTCVIRIESEKHPTEEIARLLREYKPAVIGRISDNNLVLDLRTVFPEQLEHLRKAFESLA